MATGGSAAGRYGVNPMQNSAQGFSDAFNALQQGMRSNQIAPNVGQVTPGNISAQNYQAHLQGVPAQIRNLMGGYQNPYENQVVARTTRNMADTLRQQQMGNADAAIASGAFGGGRHGVVEAVTNAEGLRNIGDMTAELRQQGFNTAAGLASQDIQNRMAMTSANQNAVNAQRQYAADSRYGSNAQNVANQMQAQQFNVGNNMANRQNYFNNLQGMAGQMGNLANQSYNVGNSINQNQMQAGQQQQQLMQQVLNQGMGGYDQLVNQPNNLLQLRLQALGMNPLNNTGTTTGRTNTQPGWGAMLGNLIGAGGNAASGGKGGGKGG